LEETKSRSSCAALSEVSLLLYQLSGKAGTTSVRFFFLVFVGALFWGTFGEMKFAAVSFWGFDDIMKVSQHQEVTKFELRGFL
jgi:hypothetical protein